MLRKIKLHSTKSPPKMEPILSSFSPKLQKVNSFIFRTVKNNGGIRENKKRQCTSEPKIRTIKKLESKQRTEIQTLKQHKADNERASLIIRETEE